MSPFFSIVVPVHNTEQFLRECLDSIRAQSFADWECLCVDDGSTDSSGAILDEYAARDSRIRVVHQKNAGVSAARNAALDLVHGEFFLFVDDDDALSPDALECFRDAFASTGADGLLCFPDEDFLKIGEYPVAPAGFQLLSSSERPVSLLSGPFAAHGYVQSRIYRRTKFGDVRFQREIRFGEDTRFWVDALCIPARWAVIRKRYYAHRERLNSAGHAVRWSLYRDCLSSYEYVFRTMSGKMGATLQEIKQYAARFRAAHHYIFVKSYRFQQNASTEIQSDFFRLANSVLEAAKPAAPFYKTDILRLAGHRLHLVSIANPMADVMDKIRMRIRHLYSRVGTASRQN